MRAFHSALVLLFLPYLAFAGDVLARDLEDVSANQAKQAVSCLRQHLEQHPEDGLLLRAVVNFEQHRYYHAIADLTEVLRLNPEQDLVQVRVLRAHNYLMIGHFTEADADYGEAIRRDPKCSSAYEGRGCLRVAGRKLDEALADLTEAIRLDPKAVRARVNRGAVHELKGDVDAALADLTGAIGIDPKDPGLHVSRAALYERTGRLNEASAGLDEAIRLDPKDARALLTRGGIRCRKDDVEGAIADLTEAIRIDPKRAEAYRQRAEAYRKKHDLERAVADLTEAIRLAPREPTAYHDRAMVYVGQGEYLKADADYKQSTKLEPTYVDFHHLATSNASGDPTVSDTAAAVPTDAESFFARAFQRASSGEWKAAIADYTKAIRLAPDNVHAYRGRAMAYETRMEYAKAIADYGEVIRLAPNDVDSYYARAHACEANQAYDQTIADYTEIIRLSVKKTDLAIAHHHRGFALQLAQRDDEAVADYVEVIHLFPDDPSTYRTIAWLLATSPQDKVRNGEEAARYARRGCELTDWYDTLQLDCLAAAEAERGRFKQAVKWEEKALKGPGAAYVARMLRERLDLYKAGKPYRDPERLLLYESLCLSTTAKEDEHAEGETKPRLEKEKKILAEMDPEKAIRYASGNACSLNNHPAMHASRTGEQEIIVVTANSCHETFPIGAFDAARKRYFRLLKERGYLGAHFPEMKDANISEFSAPELTALDQTSPGTLFRYFSGKSSELHDLPLLHASGSGGRQVLTVVGRSCEEEFTIRDFKRAMTRYQELLKERGFHPE